MFLWYLGGFPCAIAMVETVAEVQAVVSHLARIGPRRNWGGAEDRSAFPDEKQT